MGDASLVEACELGVTVLQQKQALSMGFVITPLSSVLNSLRLFVADSLSLSLDPVTEVGSAVKEFLKSEALTLVFPPGSYVDHVI